MFLSSSERDFLNALRLYSAARRTALRSALTLWAPLSVDAAEDLRIHYSNYFVNLMSAAELISDGPFCEPMRFVSSLEAAFGSFTGSSGQQGRLYVRELRNAIVHRGLDIAWAAHFAADFPMLIAPSPIRDRKGGREYESFSYYLLGIIEGCEAVVGPTIRTHLETHGIFDRELDVDACVAEEVELIQRSTVMPEWTKKESIKSLLEIDRVGIHRERMDMIQKLLEPFDFMPFFQSMLTAQSTPTATQSASIPPDSPR